MTDRPIRVGVQLQAQHADHAEIRRAVAEAKERYDLAPIRDLVAWRDPRHTG